MEKKDDCPNVWAEMGCLVGMLALIVLAIFGAISLFLNAGISRGHW